MPQDTPSTPPLRRPRQLRLFLVLSALLAVAGGLAFLYAQRAEAAPAGRGAQVVAENGCFACHGRSDSDQRFNLRQASSGEWRPKPNPSFWENSVEDAAILQEWIREGCVATKKDRHQKLFIQMPAYGARMPASDIEAAAAWILAEALRLNNGFGNAVAPLPVLTPQEVESLPEAELALLGDRLSRRQGCFQCHGESGQGGVANPASFKGYIPGFFGHDFLELTDGGKPEEIRHWIDHGRGHAIESGPLGFLAQAFFARQTIPMPAYDQRLTEGEKSLLVRYLQQLNRQGPLSASNLQAKIETLRAASKKSAH